jgi:hypothetical protein
MADRRLKIGEAVERWASGQGEGVSGRVTFQLEMVYVVKTRKDGTKRRYGPYGPYWYMYYWTPRGSQRVSSRTRYRSRYVGRPDRVDPHSLSPQQVASLIRRGRPGGTASPDTSYRG